MDEKDFQNQANEAVSLTQTDMKLPLDAHRILIPVTGQAETVSNQKLLESIVATEKLAVETISQATLLQRKLMGIQHQIILDLRNELSSFEDEH